MHRLFQAAAEEAQGGGRGDGKDQRRQQQRQFPGAPVADLRGPVTGDRCKQLAIG